MNSVINDRYLTQIIDGYVQSNSELEEFKKRQYVILANQIYKWHNNCYLMICSGCGLVFDNALSQGGKQCDKCNILFCNNYCSNKILMQGVLNICESCTNK